MKNGTTKQNARRPPRSIERRKKQYLIGIAILAIGTTLTVSAIKLANRKTDIDLQKQDSSHIANHDLDPTEEYYALIVRGIGSGGNGVLSVRPAQAVEQNRLTNDQFRHGGVDPTRAQVRVLSDSVSRTEATRILAGFIKPGSLRYPPLSSGFVATVDGRTMTIDDWGDVDFGQLRQSTH